MPQLNAYLTFDGNCADAMRFYERVLGAKLEKLLTFAEMPGGCGEMPPSASERIMHSRLVKDDLVLMASDSMPDRPYEGMKGFSLTLSYDTPEEAKPIFEALSEGGKVMMPFDKTFWSNGSGIATDRFGTPWIVNGGLIEV